MKSNKTLREEKVNNFVDSIINKLLSVDHITLKTEYLLDFDIIKYKSIPYKNKNIFEIFDIIKDYYGLEIFKQGVKLRLIYWLEHEKKYPYCDLGHYDYCNCKEKRKEYSFEEDIIMLINQFCHYSKMLEFDSRRNKKTYSKEYLKCDINIVKHSCDFYNNLVKNNNELYYFAGLYFIDEKDNDSDYYEEEY